MTLHELLIRTTKIECTMFYCTNTVVFTLVGVSMYLPIQFATFITLYLHGKVLKKKIMCYQNGFKNACK